MRASRPGLREMRSWIVLLALPVVCGCQHHTPTVLGKAPKGPIHRIIAVRAGDTPSQVTLQGVMVEKCPVAGCWFYLHDATGIIKVDTKAAGFVVVNVPLQTQVTVSGKIETDGDEVSLAGTGLSY
jgi:uncharacterized protein YdeI (BOF family)